MSSGVFHLGSINAQTDITTVPFAPPKRLFSPTIPKSKKLGTQPNLIVQNGGMVYQ
jgi:hypothetical protein